MSPRPQKWSRDRRIVLARRTPRRQASRRRRGKTERRFDQTALSSLLTHCVERLETQESLYPQVAVQRVNPPVGDRRIRDLARRQTNSFLRRVLATNRHNSLGPTPIPDVQ